MQSGEREKTCNLGCSTQKDHHLEKKERWRISLFSSIQSLSRVGLFVTPWIAGCQASLSIPSRSSLKFTSIELVMPSSHLILCHPLLLLPPITLSIRVFSNESTLRMRWPKYWSFSFSTIPSKEIPGLISFSCPQSFPASGSFPVSQLFTLAGQSVGVSASTSDLPVNT